MTTKHAPKKSLDILGLILIIPPILFQFGWLPLADRTTIILSLVLCIVAIAFCVRGFNQPDVTFRVLSILVVLTGVVIALINILQLM